ncbi:transcriptional regulator TbsP domain-containing protein [Halorarum halobium]|uniref:transcriptional regulator TbsP domain-containing protein n=1 Tax=Halorarum halobium TaxID=3075121 RepID=UPI0028B08B6A|nr:DUF5821 family protein [Halobaculum sp. XH14]
MPARSLEATPSVAETLLATARDPLFVSPPPRLARSVARSVRTGKETARLFLTPADAEDLFDEFRTATAAAEAIDGDRLVVRTAPDIAESLTLGDGRAWVHVRADSTMSSLSTSDDEVTAAFREAFEIRWAEAADYRPEVPARDVLLDTFRDRWPDAARTLSGALDGAEAVREDDVLDPVGVCTLVGARHELFSIELGEWAREVNFSSRTEVARAKERLASADIVETRRVPEGVGRPRQQLALADEALGEVDPGELIPTVQERLGISR